MDFTLTDLQHELAHRYAEIGRHHARHPLCEAFNREAWRALSDAGLWRIPVPVESGGTGGSWFDFATAFEGLASTMRSIGFGMAAANQASLIHALLCHAGREQRAAWLPRLMAGEVGATAISERGTGTEIHALQTHLADDAPGYRLTGQKYNISVAPHAAILLVAARYDDGARPSTALVLVDSGSPGIARSMPQSTLGVRDLPIGELDFDDVYIARGSLLGAPRDGMRSLMQTASMNRAYFALLSASVVQPFLDDALHYTGQRKILDVPIDTHQHVQRRLVDIRMRAQRSRWMALAALAQLHGNDPAALESCSIAKLSAAHDLTQSALDLLALYGTQGYRSGAVSAFVADALAMVSAGGSEEMHRRNIFAQMQRRQDTPAPRRSQAAPETAPA